MLHQGPYRIYKCISQYKDKLTSEIVSVRKTLDLGDVATYDEHKSWDDSVSRTICYFKNNLPPVVIKVSYGEFDKAFETFLAQSQLLDNRSLKKKIKYKGPVAMYFTTEQDVTVMAVYPKNYNFDNKPPDVIQEDLLGSMLTPMN